MAVGPQDDSVAIILKHFQSLYGKRHGFTHLRIVVYHDGTVKINRYD